MSVLDDEIIKSDDLNKLLKAKKNYLRTLKRIAHYVTATTITGFKNHVGSAILDRNPRVMVPVEFRLSSKGGPLHVMHFAFYLKDTMYDPCKTIENLVEQLDSNFRHIEENDLRRYEDITKSLEIRTEVIRRSIENTIQRVDQQIEYES